MSALMLCKHKATKQKLVLVGYHRRWLSYGIFKMMKCCKQCGCIVVSEQPEGILNYGKHKGSARHEHGYWYGKILGTKDIVTYEAESLESLKDEFCMAVDDWIEIRENITLEYTDLRRSKVKL